MRIRSQLAEERKLTVAVLGATEENEKEQKRG